MAPVPEIGVNSRQFEDGERVPRGALAYGRAGRVGPLGWLP